MRARTTSVIGTGIERLAQPVALEVGMSVPTWIAGVERLTVRA